MRILFYGAGVIGSIYAAKLAMSGVDISMLARGSRYAELKKNGLKIQGLRDNGITSVKDIVVIDKLSPEDKYDFIFVTVRKDQVDEVLPQLKNNASENIVFMLNNSSGTGKWLESIDKSHIMIAFPGAGGKRENGIVHYHIVSSIIQPTMIGELDGKLTNRLQTLNNLLKTTGFKVSISRNILDWQLSHVAMVCPMANSIYMDGGSNYTTAKNTEAISLMNKAIKEALRFLKTKGYQVVPFKMHLLLRCPLWLMNIIMKTVYNSKWAETVISNHTITAREEMKQLTEEFIKIAEEQKYDLRYFKLLASYN